MGNPEDDDDFPKSTAFHYRRRTASKPRRPPPLISGETPNEETWNKVVHTLNTLVFDVDLEPIQPKLVKVKPDETSAPKIQPTSDAGEPPPLVEDEQA